MAFDLEKAIAAWRRPFEHNRAFSSEDLEELEGSLRDRVEALVDAGMPEEAAFREAVRRLGSYGTAEVEYRNVYWGKLKRRRQLLNEFSWRFSMLKNYLKIAFRNLRRHPGYTFINVFGLAVGMACCLLILLYVRHELSYDRFHEKIDRIYRLAVEYELPGSTFDNALSSAPMAPALLNDYPDIVTAVRVHPSSDLIVSYADSRFYEDRFFFADASVFEMFTFPLLKGSPKMALTEPNSVVITEGIAQKYFGEEDPIGKVLMVDNERAYTVTGVMENLPGNSHLQFDFLASFVSLEAIMEDGLESWTYNPFFTYVLLPPGYDAGTLNTKLATFIDSHVGEKLASIDWKLTAFLQPLSEIHLHPLANEEHQGDIRYVYVFSAIAVLILLIACINFINLSTARSSTRAREVGMRKVMGAHRGQLAGQFLGESLLTAGLAALVAVVLVALLLPVFGSISGKTLAMNHLEVPVLALGLIGIILLVGLLSGSYSAFFLTAFRPAEVLKAGATTKPGRPTLRNGLVAFQFTVSVILLVGTMVIQSQLQHMKDKKLGFDREQVVVVPVKDSLVLARQETIKAELLQNPSITSVALASLPPGRGAWGTIARRPHSPDRPPEIKVLFVDPDFVETLGIELAAGREFSADMATDARQSVILNETAVRSFGWSRPEEAVGQALEGFGDGDQASTVIGIVQDFNFQPLRYGMQPLMLIVAPDAYEYFLVKIAPGDVERSIAYLQDVWSRVAPQWPFEYSLLDEELDTQYRGEQRLGQLFGYFAALAIFIACLGLFGLAAFTAQQRTKEIGVRKVLGANVTSLVALLSSDFLKLVGFAFLVGAPLAYLAMQRWLEEFAYRIELGPGVFILAGGAALAIALLAVSYQSVRAAIADPVKSLRYE